MTVTGTIKASDGEPLEFANVWESDVAGKKTGLNTSANEQGKFTLQHSGTGYVSASFVGYKRKTVPVSGELNITLENEFTQLPEADVVAKKGLARIQVVGIVLLALGLAAVVIDRVRAARA